MPGGRPLQKIRPQNRGRTHLMWEAMMQGGTYAAVGKQFGVSGAAVHHAMERYRKILDQSVVVDLGRQLDEQLKKLQRMCQDGVDKKSLAHIEVYRKIIESRAKLAGLNKVDVTSGGKPITLVINGIKDTDI